MASRNDVLVTVVDIKLLRDPTCDVLCTSTEVYYISGDRAPIPSPVNDLSPKTWRFVTRFTSQS